MALRNPVELIQAISCFCAGGVLEKFPKLRVAFLEGNCAWLPWLLIGSTSALSCMARWLRCRCRGNRAELFLRQCFISVDPDEDRVTDVIKRIGDETILISTDYPHIDAHFPHALDEFFEIDEITDASRRKILWDNCARLYGM